MRIILLVVVMLMIGGGNAFADPVTIKEGFYTGNIYRELSEHEKHGYITGIFDGIRLSPMFGTSTKKDSWAWYVPCMSQILGTNAQLKAIIDKYLADHPEEWKDQMHTIFYRAIYKVCVK